MSFGVIYLAMCMRCYREALRSIESLKTHMPNISTTLFTRNCEVDFSPLFSTVFIAEDVHPFHAKIKALINAPYDRTLYLDADTHVYGDLQDIFTLLDWFHIAAAHAPMRQAREQASIPDSFPEYNTGVIAYRDSHRVREFLKAWDHGFGLFNGPPHDQPSFRRTLYYSNLRVATLPSEYNCRMCLGGYVHDTIKILHTRKSLPPMEFINKVGPRAYVRGRILEE